MLKQESQQQDDTINESGMAHAAGFADGGSGFEEGATMMQDNGDVLKESIYTLQDFIDLVFNKDKELGQRYFNRWKTNPKDFPNVANSAKELKFIDKGFLKKIGVYNDTEIDKILNFLDVDVLKESPWNGDPNSNWVPGDDDIEVEVHEWSLDFERTEDTDKYPDDHILVSVNAASGGQQWNTEVELSSFIPRKEGEKYAPLVQRLINLNGGKDYKVSDDQLFKNPKTKEIANILDGLISDFADSYEVDYDDPYPDEDLMPGGKYDRMDEGAVNKSGIKKSGKRIKITESQRRLLESKGLLKEDSDTYFETLSATLDHVREMAKEMGYELDEDEVNFQFGTGGIPYEKTKSATIPLLKDGEPIMGKSGKPLNRAISVSIYRMGSGRYELTAYKTF